LSKSLPVVVLLSVPSSFLYCVDVVGGIEEVDEHREDSDEDDDDEEEDDDGKIGDVLLDSCLWSVPI
jgi:hypothetical protein